MRGSNARRVFGAVRYLIFVEGSDQVTECGGYDFDVSHPSSEAWAKYS